MGTYALRQQLKMEYPISFVLLEAASALKIRCLDQQPNQQELLALASATTTLMVLF